MTVFQLLGQGLNSMKFVQTFMFPRSILQSLVSLDLFSVVPPCGWILKKISFCLCEIRNPIEWIAKNFGTDLHDDISDMDLSSSTTCRGLPCIWWNISTSSRWICRKKYIHPLLPNNESYSFDMAFCIDIQCKYNLEVLDLNIYIRFNCYMHLHITMLFCTLLVTDAHTVLFHVNSIFISLILWIFLQF